MELVLQTDWKIMLEKFKAISLSYQRAPLQVREAFSLDELGCKRLIQYFKEFTPVEEVIVVSTCNRTEIYCVGRISSVELIKTLCIHAGVSFSDRVYEFFEIFEEPKQAATHLFYMSLGLYSQVIGDLQIINQVKNAYQWSADEGMSGPLVHRMLHSVFFANKRVSQETSFRDGAASLSYVATELIKKFFPNFSVPKVLVVGLGEIGLDVCKNLAEIKGIEVTVVNRTRSKAEDIARTHNFRVNEYSSLKELIRDHHVVISSVRSESPIINQDLIADQDLWNFKYFIDLSVPRSIDANIEETKGVILYNLDNIQSKANATLVRRKESVPHVEKVLQASINEFFSWTDETQFSPLIQKMKESLEEIRKQEINRYVDLTERESEVVETVTKGLINKVLKLPVLQLKSGL